MSDPRVRKEVEKMVNDDDKPPSVASPEKSTPKVVKSPKKPLPDLPRYIDHDEFKRVSNKQQRLGVGRKSPLNILKQEYEAATGNKAGTKFIKGKRGKLVGWNTVHKAIGKGDAVLDRKTWQLIDVPTADKLKTSKIKQRSRKDTMLNIGNAASQKTMGSGQRGKPLSKTPSRRRRRKK
jgi:hypothetical protein